jgi:cytochrome c peroxidase
LEQQVLQPVLNPKEMDMKVEDAAARVGLDVPTLQKALASYVRTILSGNSPYDRYLAGDREALTEQQRLGLQLFRGKGGCTSCHLGPNLLTNVFITQGLVNRTKRARSTGAQDRGAFKTRVCAKLLEHLPGA